MAFTLQAIVGSTTVTLTDGNPFELLSARGMGGAPVRRVTQQGPAQDGDTDTGYRLQPREIELAIGFKASTDAALDAHRDTLMGVFRPLTGTPVNLRATRDDAEVRQIDCHTIGEIKIDLLPEHRPGHYHRATVRLRAPDPAYYELAPGTVTVTGTVGVAGSWWLAGGAIGSAQVMMSGGTPAQGSVWSYAGTIADSGSYTLAFRSGQESGTASGSVTYAFAVDNTDGGEDFSFSATLNYDSATRYGVGYLGAYSVGTSFMPSGTTNYFFRHDGSAQMTSADGLPLAGKNRFNNIVIGVALLPISGTARRWRSNASGASGSYWNAAIPLYALYSPGLTGAQIAALDAYMSGVNGGTIGQVAAVAYEGNLPEFPTINIRGPISSPVITNLTTGHTLDFGTITIGAGTTYVIDTRYGYKTVTAGTVNKRGELSSDSDLGEFHLAPNPTAPSGVNSIAMYGNNIGTATQIQIVYYNRFTSY